MKKVLSVLLAAAMVMGMSVSAFAAEANKTWTDGATGKVDEKVSEVVKFDGGVVIVSADGSFTAVGQGDALKLEPGDDLYFPLIDIATSDVYTGTLDTKWSINIKSNGLVEKASYYTYPEDTDDADFTYNWAVKDAKFVKVEIEDDLEVEEKETVKFEMYIADGDYKKTTTEKVIVEGKIAHDIEAQTIDFENDYYVLDADRYASWKVKKGQKGIAYFDFNDNAYFTVKMISEEKVYLNLSTAYDKDIDAEYNEYDADLEFYNFKGNNDSFIKTGELFIEAKEDTFIYEIVDGELVAVEAEWVEDYVFAKTNKKDGWVIETDELGYYVVSDMEVEIAAEEVVEEAPSTDKANPETGANDFVGAAVALAVVSVAAAGALALKK